MQPVNCELCIEANIKHTRIQTAKQSSSAQESKYVESLSRKNLILHSNGNVT
jgi:hypothetical protein